MGSDYFRDVRMGHLAVYSDSIPTVHHSRVTSQHKVPPLHRSPLCDDLFRSGSQSWGDLNIPTQIKIGLEWATVLPRAY
jgi:hypothetical protein